MSRASSVMTAKQPQNVLPDLMLFDDLPEQEPKIPATTIKAVSSAKNQQSIINESATLVHQTISSHGNVSGETLLKTARCQAGLGLLTELITDRH